MEDKPKLVVGIAIKRGPRLAMELLEEADVSIDAGVGGDYKGSLPRKAGRPARQVTVLTVPGWVDACKEVGAEVPWVARRANLFISGLRLGREDIGKFIFIGNTGPILEITGETRPCSRMDEAMPGLKRALEPEWRAGVTCLVVRGGKAKVGDIVYFNLAIGTLLTSNKD